MTVTRAKGAKGRADKFYSLIIRSRGGCEWCGRATSLETSHIIPRSWNWTRTDLDNALCLCSSDHRRWHQFGVLAAPEHLRAELTCRQERLYRKADDGVRQKFDWDAEAARLKELWTRIEAAA